MGIPYEFIRTPNPGDPGYEEWLVLCKRVFPFPSAERLAEVAALRERLAVLLGQGDGPGPSKTKPLLIPSPRVLTGDRSFHHVIREVKPMDSMPNDAPFWDWVRASLSGARGDVSAPVAPLTSEPFELPETVGVELEEPSRVARPHGERFSIRAWMPMLRRVYARLRERGEAEFCASHMGTIEEAMAALEASANAVVQVGLCRMPDELGWAEGVARIAALGGCDPARLDTLLRQPACDPGPAFTPQPLPKPEPLVLLTEDGGIALLEARTAMDALRQRLLEMVRIEPQYLKGDVDPQAKANQERADEILGESLRAEVGAIEPCRCLEGPQVCTHCGHRHHLHARTQPPWLKCVKCGTPFPNAGR